LLKPSVGISRPVTSADIFQAITDSTRRAILDRLRGGEQPVKQLAEPFEMLLPAISQHLQILKQNSLRCIQKQS